ncbi:hypothetical protein KAI04_03805 [Candidatus Pacearchaeota archaeon]|nr:hypothetical protein [Candidatus Pacearchaeota archaeon]
MKHKKPSEVIKKRVEEKKEVISKILCNSCKMELPKITDKGLCPICGIRN